MPVARNGNVWLNWREAGAGDPVVMIMGLGGSARGWYRLLPHLAARHRVVVFDNRGTGNSDRVTGPLHMGDLVADTLAVMDAAGMESAHVHGASMGGMIAQHLALDHRDRVRSLILSCTSAGGRSSGAPPWRLLTSLALRPLAGPEKTWPIVAPALYAQHTREEHPDRIKEDLTIRMADATDPRTAWAQIAALARHDTRTRLHELAGLPVTVIHGDEDALVAPERGRALAAAIPGASLVMLQGCGHLMTTDREHEAAAALLEHLARAAPSQRSAA